MKLNKILVFFAISLSISVAMRFFQILYTVDSSSGFFKREQTALGVGCLCLIAAACIALAIFSHFSFHTPKTREKSIAEAVPSLLCAAVLAYELLSQSKEGLLAWQSILLMVTGFATVLVLYGHGFTLLTPFSMPKLAFAVPPVYFIVRIICFFTSISSLALISDHVMLLAAYCTGLLFFLNFGKLQNDVDPDHTFRKLLSSGLCFVLLSVTQSVPYLILNFSAKKPYPHTTLMENLSVLAFGIFAAVFLALSFFGRRSED